MIRRIPYGADPLQFGELRLPEGEGPHPLVIVIHGGFWRARYDLEYIAPVCEALTRAGVATWSLEYRRIGNAGGGWPGTLEDVQSGGRHVRNLAQNYNLDLRRVITLGHSAGGQLALWLGSNKNVPIAGVVSLAGVADLRRAWELKLSKNVVAEFLGGSPKKFPERYARASPIERLPLGIPQRLFHGTADDSVPHELSERYVSQASKCGDDVELIKLKKSGHFELVDPKTEEFEKVRETVITLLNCHAGGVQGT
jgi:acetyl esterase/lipase